MCVRTNNLMLKPNLLILTVINLFFLYFLGKLILNKSKKIDHSHLNHLVKTEGYKNKKLEQFGSHAVFGICGTDPSLFVYYISDL